VDGHRRFQLSQLAIHINLAEDLMGNAYAELNSLTSSVSSHTIVGITRSGNAELTTFPQLQLGSFLHYGLPRIFGWTGYRRLPFRKLVE
jgi:hypothetical protein